MDDQERKIMGLLVQAHNEYTKLESTHPSDINDWVNSFHILQDILTRRVLRRDYPGDFITVKKQPMYVKDENPFAYPNDDY